METGGLETSLIKPSLINDMTINLFVNIVNTERRSKAESTPPLYPNLI